MADSLVKFPVHEEINLAKGLRHPRGGLRNIVSIGVMLLGEPQVISMPEHSQSSGDGGILNTGLAPEDLGPPENYQDSQEVPSS
jgi:hypothetical protein